ncbi:MAG: phosphatidylglycerol lysyltransferase domain-containing protein [Victivallaceae bacterium]|nr:phosphatidylglycerol lysyltransferase domain-containing protein [Victivallaceae bacterium]
MTKTKQINDHQLRFLKLYGSFPIAYSAVYDNLLTAFESPEGFISYVDNGNERIVLGDPFCAPQDLPGIVKKFLADTKRKKLSPIVLQCSHDTALAFVKHGYNANHMGVETNVDLTAFKLEGKKRARVRHWVTGAQSAGAAVVELSMQAPETLALIGSISEEWLKGKPNKHELNLLTRPLVLDYEPDTRLFCARVEEQIVSFVLFEPMYKDGKIVGYMADFVRRLDNAPKGSFDLIYYEAGKIFKTEGAATLSFGLSPLADMENTENIHNPLISTIFNVNYNYGNDMYAYQGLDAHKKAYYDGETVARVPKYLVIGGAFPINHVLYVFRFIGVIPHQSYLASMKHFAACIIKGYFTQQKVSQPAEKQKIAEIADEVVKGVPSGKIAGDTKSSVSLVGKIASVITNGFRAIAPQIEQQTLFFAGHFDADTEKLYVKVSNIADGEKAIHFVHNIVFVPYKNGYNLIMTVEVDPEMTVAQTYQLAEKLKEKICKRIPEILYVRIEFKPDGSFFSMLDSQTIDNVADEDIT